MYKSKIDIADEFIKPLNNILNKFNQHLRNQAIRAGVVAAGKPMLMGFRTLASKYVSTNTSPTRKVRGSNSVVPRPHLKDAITNKVWKVPNGNGYINIIGPVSVQVPHAHWFGDKAPTDRRTKLGYNRGTHLSRKGGPARLLSRTFDLTIEMATSAFASEVKQKIDSFTP